MNTKLLSWPSSLGPDGLSHSHNNNVKCCCVSEMSAADQTRAIKYRQTASELRVSWGRTRKCWAASVWYRMISIIRQWGPRTARCIFWTRAMDLLLRSCPQYPVQMPTHRATCWRDKILPLSRIIRDPHLNSIWLLSSGQCRAEYAMLTQDAGPVKGQQCSALLSLL